ncbi:MAG TPA: phytanoyl-CoA dioxygenase family protein [Candidatus Xenobia bacterium]|jgi:hypothetical protein
MWISEADRHSYLEDGFLCLRGAFPAAVAQAMIPLVWKAVAAQPPAPDARIILLAEVIREAPAPSVYTPRYRGTLDELCGPGRWQLDLGGVGHWHILLPGFAQPPGRGWHVDTEGDAVESFLAVEYFTDVGPGQGGTAIRPGSHRHRESTAHSPIQELTGSAGDVFFLHPLLWHAVNSNPGTVPRLAAVKKIHVERGSLTTLFESALIGREVALPVERTPAP